MDNKAYFMIVHNKLQKEGNFTQGEWVPNQSDFDIYRKRCEEEKKRQDEFFKKQAEKKQEKNKHNQ
jgi:hypothetical protein